MSDFTLYAEHAVTPDGVRNDVAVRVSAGRIVEVTTGMRSDSDHSAEWILPGFIDLHVHGGGGYSVHSPDEVAKLSTFLPQTGVTAYLPTLSTSAPDATLTFLRAVKDAQRGSSDAGAEIVGSHLEGPFLSKERKGAQPEAHIRVPDETEVDAWIEASQGTLSRVSLAPEVPNARRIIALLAAHGVGVSIGHSNATYEEACEAVEWGAVSTTHTYNAMSPLDHRRPGVVGLALTHPRVTAELISDGVHVHPIAALLLIRAKGPERVAVVTDGVPPMALPPGTHKWRDREVMSDGVAVRDKAGNLTGSATGMDGALRNLVNWGVSVQAAAQMLSTTPARLARVDNRKGHIATGYDADLVLLDDQLRPLSTFCRGNLTWSRNTL